MKTAKPGRYGDGDGLYLLVQRPAKPNEPPRGYWLFRFTRAGKMREMGLGRARGQNAVSLAEARDKASVLYRAVRNGRDPLADREAGNAAAKAEAQQTAVRSVTFREAAETYIVNNKAAWRNSKHAAQWGTTLASYAYPVFGNLPIADVATVHILAALEPIWREKPETAARLRGRMEAVLSASTAKGLRSGDNPARWKGHLAEILPARSKVAAVVHHAALPYADIGVFMAKLRSMPGVSPRALEFAILTAARTGEVIGATWGEIDLAAKVWTVPAARMKAQREHRVPLTDAAMALLTEIAKLRASASMAEPVFPGGVAGKALSNMALTMALRRMKRTDLTAHGFRSTFRDWAAEQTSFPGDVAEMALAHAIGDKVEAAYRRGDLFDKRRKLMDAWSAYCVQPSHIEGGVQTQQVTA